MMQHPRTLALAISFALAFGVSTAAVQDTGLPVETYNQIAIALQTDEALRGQLESMMN